MGTNFDLRKRINKEEKEKLKQLIEDENWDELVENIPEIIHIGKRSAGWKFCWDAHDFRYFNPTKESLIEWLKSGDIYDEYGEKYTFDQFWNEEIWFDGLDCAEYYEKYDEKNPDPYKYWVRSPEKISEYWMKYGIVVNKYNEFYIDNLRFTVDEDFG